MSACNDESIRVQGGGDDDDDPIIIPPLPDEENTIAIDTLNI